MKPSLLAAPLAIALGYAPSALAVTWYVSPTGTATSGCTSRATPCDLGTAGSSAVAGDTVILMDGVYNTGLWVANSGTPTDWITFQADDCAMPIIQGPGPAPSDDDQSSGVGSAEAEYLRFRGIVSRGWNMGFANGWTGSHTPDSNGHWDIEYCIAESNGRTGFTSFSAEGFRLKNSISAHNGSSTLHSWSSGVTLYASPGGLIEGCVSFENVDGEKHTDGNGFIVDETTDNAILVNNIAFRNGGSCLRLTKSSGTTFINNTCYHNAQDPQATGPTNPSELYFTNASSSNTTSNVNFMNNVLVNTGQGGGAAAVVGQPTAGWSNNVVMQGTVSSFVDPEGDPPNFTLSTSAANLVGQGGTGARVPTDAIGFDPKCLAKGPPQLVGQTGTASWWQNSIDFEYIKSIGGVAACFNAQARTGTPDIGAYAAGNVGATTPGSCIPPVVDTGDAMPSASGDPTAPSASGDPTAPSASGDPTAPSASGNPASPGTGPVPPATSSEGVTPGTGTDPANGTAASTDANPGTNPASGPGTTTTGDPGSGMVGTGAVPPGTVGASDGETVLTNAPSTGDFGGTPGGTIDNSGMPVGSATAAETPNGCACAVPGRPVAAARGFGRWLLGLFFAAVAVARRFPRRDANRLAKTTGQ